jgi:hypothetical protein
MFKNYKENEHKWLGNWEKNLDAVLKGVKKFKDDIMDKDKPKFTQTTSSKYRVFFDLLENELQEAKEIYQEYEPVPINKDIRDTKTVTREETL